MWEGHLFLGGIRIGMGCMNVYCMVYAGTYNFKAYAAHTRCENPCIVGSDACSSDVKGMHFKSVQ